MFQQNLPVVSKSTRPSSGNVSWVFQVCALPKLVFIIGKLPENSKTTGSCVICAPLDWYIGQHIDRHLTKVSVDISIDVRTICRPTYWPTLGQYSDRDVLVDILVERTSICLSTLNPDVSWPVYHQFYSSTLLSFIVLILFPVNCILCIWKYFSWVSFLITTEFAAHDPNIKPQILS